MKYIYAYTNLINNKKYIGQTNNIERRKKQHLQDSLSNYDERRYQQAIHCAIRKHGIENFSFDILEECLEDKASEREQYWIVFYNSLAPNGYNLTNGGELGGNNTSRFTETEKEKMRQRLLARDEIASIATDYNCSASFISSVNCGNCFKSALYSYPIQNKLLPDFDKYKKIIDLLKYSKLPMSRIAIQCGVARNTVGDINRGKQKFVKENFNEDFPIRKEANKGYTLEPVETIHG